MHACAHHLSTFYKAGRAFSVAGRERRDAASPRRCWCFFLAESCRVLCKWRLIRRMWGSSPSHAFLRKSVCRSWSQTLIHPLNHQTGPRSSLFCSSAYGARIYYMCTLSVSGRWLWQYFARAHRLPIKKINTRCECALAANATIFHGNRNFG